MRDSVTLCSGACEASEKHAGELWEFYRSIPLSLGEANMGRSSEHVLYTAHNFVSKIHITHSTKQHNFVIVLNSLKKFSHK